MGLENQGSKPSGTIGKVLGRMINNFHTTLYTNWIEIKYHSINLKIG